MHKHTYTYAHTHVRMRIHPQIGSYKLANGHLIVKWHLNFKNHYSLSVCNAKQKYSEYIIRNEKKKLKSIHNSDAAHKTSRQAIGPTADCRFRIVFSSVLLGLYSMNWFIWIIIYRWINVKINTWKKGLSYLTLNLSSRNSIAFFSWSIQCWQLLNVFFWSVFFHSP